MDILVIGVSSVFVRRVLPALLSLDCVDRIHISSRREFVHLNIPEGRRGEFFFGYDTALRMFSGDLVYVSLPNSLHDEWVRRALESGFHVIVDKPAFLDWKETSSNLLLAKQKNLCLAEALVWPFHPQVGVIQSKFSELGTGPSLIQSVFSFPPLTRSNFRNYSKLGGGSLFDLLPYAVTPGRIFFNDVPVTLSVDILSKCSENDIDTSFAINAIYPRGRVFQGFFGFTTEYRNSMLLLGQHMSVTFDPVFTFTNSLDSSVEARVGSKTLGIPYKSADCFAVFFRLVINSIITGEWACWSDTLRRDASIIRMAVESAQEKL